MSKDNYVFGWRGVADYLKDKHGLSVSRTTLWDWSCNLELPKKHITPKRIRYKKSDIDVWIETIVTQFADEINL